MAHAQVRNSRLLQEIVALRNEVRSDVGSLRNEVRSDVGSLKKSVNTLQNQMWIVHIFIIGILITGFCFYATLTDIQEFKRDRIDAMQRVLYQTDFDNCSTQANAFGLVHNGYAMDVTVSHINCSDHGPPSMLLSCNGVDLALVAKCPSTGMALNSKTHTLPQIGDDVISYGFGKWSKVWNGVLVSTFGKNETGFPPFIGVSNVPEDAFTVSTSTDRGFSGSPVLNSYGLVGVVSLALKGDVSSSGYAGVIPISYAFQCIKQYAEEGRLPTLKSCQEVSVLDAPVLLSIPQTFRKVAKLFVRAWNQVKGKQ